MYSEFDFEKKPNLKELAQRRAKKQKQASLLVALLLVGGLAYYFLGYLPEERVRAKEEVEEILKDNWNVTVDKLDKSL
jgi:hypothetical protein